MAINYSDPLNSNDYVHIITKRATPEIALRKALYFCIKYNATLLQIESNQGGDLWYNLWDNIVDQTGMSNDERMPGLEIVRASSSTGGKMERASQMLIKLKKKKKEL